MQSRTKHPVFVIPEAMNERALAGLLVRIGSISVWNRLNAATVQVAGEWAA